MGGKKRGARIAIRIVKRTVRKHDRLELKREIESFFENKPLSKKMPSSNICTCAMCIGSYQDRDMKKQRSRKKRSKERKQDRQFKNVMIFGIS